MYYELNCTNEKNVINISLKTNFLYLLNMFLHKETIYYFLSINKLFIMRQKLCHF